MFFLAFFKTETAQNSRRCFQKNVFFVGPKIELAKVENRHV